MTPSTSNPNCYARCLGDCRGAISGEHVVSGALLEAISQGDKRCNVYGLKFLPPSATADDPAQIGISSLTANILCEAHNSALSTFDAEITKFFNAMERLVTSEHRGEPPAQNSYISGDHVERWMMKTLLNGLFSGTFPAPFFHSFKGQHFPDEWIHTIYRNKALHDKCGLYLAGRENSFIDHHVFKLEVVGREIGVVGLRMWVYGTPFTLLCQYLPDAFPELATAIHRPARIITQKTRNAIVFSWAGASSGSWQELRMSERPFTDATSTT